MNEPLSKTPQPSFEAPVMGCVAGGCVIPTLWLFVGAIAFHEGSPGWAGVPILAIMLAPLGFGVGFLFNLWQDRKVTLSDDALQAELQSMSMESLIEYKTLCPPQSREYNFAVAELARRNASFGESPPQM